jgi:hypothetical protein
MVNHLRISHQINTVNIVNSAMKRTAGLMDPEGSPKGVPEKKSLFARRITLWLCKDLLPFSLVNGKGFRDWIRTTGVL